MNIQLRACAAAACLAVAASVSARDFRSADVHPTDYPTVEAVRQMGKPLKEQSKGKLGVKVYPERRAGHRARHDRAAEDRRARHDAHQRRAAEQHRARDDRRRRCRSCSARPSTCARVLDGPIGDEILAAMEAQGMVGLAFYDSGARSIYTAKKPIKTLADMKGMKIRVQQSDLFVAMIEALGANPTPMPYGEVYTGAEDRHRRRRPRTTGRRTSRRATSRRPSTTTLTEHSMVPEVLVFSKKIWDTLSKDDQALIRKAAKESVPVHAQALGRARGQVAQGRRGRRRAGRRRSPTSRRSSTRWSRSTPSSRTRRSCKSLVKRIQATPSKRRRRGRALAPAGAARIASPRSRGGRA